MIPPNHPDLPRASGQIKKQVMEVITILCFPVGLEHSEAHCSGVAYGY